MIPIQTMRRTFSGSDVVTIMEIVAKVRIQGSLALLEFAALHDAIILNFHIYRYPSLWLYANNPMLYVSASHDDPCSIATYSMEDYGNITIGVSYHIEISINDTHLSIAASGGDKNDWNMAWVRNVTSASHVGEELSVWYVLITHITSDPISK